MEWFVAEWSYNICMIWLDFGHGLLFLEVFWLSETDEIWGSGHFLENAWEEYSEIWHAGVSWTPAELIRF